MQFAPPPVNNYGHHQAMYSSSQPAWIQPGYPATFTAEPDDMNPNSVLFMPPPVVPSQSYHPHQHQQQQQHQLQQQQPPPAAGNGAYPAAAYPVSPSLSPPPPRPPQQQPQHRPTAKASAARQTGNKKLAPLLPSPPASHNGDGSRRDAKNKKRKNDASEDEDSEDTSSDDGTGGASPTGVPAADGGAPLRRPPGACTYCRRVKMKCEFPPGAEKCKRCRTGNHNCVVEGRKPRRAPSKREYLLAQLRQKDGIIESLLKQLHNPYQNQHISTATVHSNTPDADQHRQDVVAWLDQLQASVRNPPKRADAASAVSARLSHRGDSDDESANGGHHHTLLSDELDVHPTLPDAASPFGFLATAALGNLRMEEPGHRQKRVRADGETSPEDEVVGIADYEYFVPGPSLDLDRRISLTDKYAGPDLIIHGIIAQDEIAGLFETFHARVNPFMGVLDSRIHTPVATFSRCPLLFTTVCAIALRYSDRPAQFPLAMHYAKHGAAVALVDGWKSAELAQAYIFLSMWSVPSRKLEEDRSRTYAALAVRIASDLNVGAAVGKKPRDEREALELANHRRLWMACFTLDKQTAAAYGEQSTVREGQVAVTLPEGFPETMSDSNPFDIHLAAKLQLMRDLTRFHSEIFSDGALSADLDLREIVLRYDTEFISTSEHWHNAFQSLSDQSNAAATFRCKLLPFYIGSTRLVILSFMLQQAFKFGPRASDEVFFRRSFDVASKVVNIMLDLIAPSGYLRYAPDCYFVYCTFAAAFLLRLLRPECKQFIKDSREREVYAAIDRVIETFKSSRIAIDDNHAPRLYAEFLSKLIAKHRLDATRTRSARSTSPPQSYPSPASSTSSGSIASTAAVSTAATSCYGPTQPPAPAMYVPPGVATYAPVDMSAMPEMTLNGAAFPTWDPRTAAYPADSMSGYATPESMPEQFFAAASPASASNVSLAGAPLELGGNASYEFTFTTPPPEELKCQEEERSSVWWNSLAQPAFSWISEGEPLGVSTTDVFPSPYAPQGAFMTQAF